MIPHDDQTVFHRLLTEGFQTGLQTPHLGFTESDASALEALTGVGAEFDALFDGRLSQQPDELFSPWANHAQWRSQGRVEPGVVNGLGAQEAYGIRAVP